MNTGATELTAWLSDLAARRPVPGGGGAAALGAAIGAAVGAMAARYTTGKRWTDREDEACALGDRLATASEELVALADADAEAYRQLRAALKDPARSEEDRGPLYAAAQDVPLRLLERCHACGAGLHTFLPRCNPNLASDCRAALHLLTGAAGAAWETLAVNRPDAAIVDRARQLLEELRAWDATAVS